MNLLTKLRYVPKRFGMLAAFVAVAAVPAALLAWGPDRPTYTIANPADHVTFNSITDNPLIGDEREFVSVKDAANTADGGWKDTVTVEPGKEYLVRVYVHNNADANLNLKALNTRVSAGVPTTTGKNVTVSGFVTADNAAPQQVWDDIRFSSDKNFNLAYIPGSAEIFNNGYAAGGAGKSLPDSIVTSAGAKIGYETEGDGVIPGCFQYVSYVYFKVKPQFEQSGDFETAKTVSEHDKFDWKESVNSKPGDLVDFRIKYKNVGSTQQDNVVVKDQLPAGLSYVAGSTKLYNAQNPNGKTLSDEVTKGGVNIGSHAAGASSFVTFTAKVAGNDQLPTCGPNTLKNVATVETDDGNKEDDASVVVPKECQPAESKFTCDALKIEKISETQRKLTVTKTVENAEYVRTVFVVRDEQGREVARVNDADGVYTYTQSKPGKYTVEAQVVVKVDGQEKTSPVGNCKGEFEVVKEEVKPEYVCTKLEKIEKSRDTYEFQTTATAKGNVTIKEVKVDFGDNQSKTVDYGTAVSHTYKPGEYTATAYVTFTVGGQTVANQTSDACKVAVTVQETPKTDECKPGVPVGDDRCEVLGEETPKELPSTGPEALLGGLFGTSALGYGIYSYVASRRALRDSMNR